MGAMHVLACADKFRGTLTAPEFGEAVAAGAEGHEVVIQPLADGGEHALGSGGVGARVFLAQRQVFLERQLLLAAVLVA